MKPWRVPTVALLVIAAEHRWASAVRLLHEQDVDRALACLRLTTPDLQLVYPPDAEQHVQEIYNAMLPWKPDFKALKRYSYHVEDLWMTDIRSMWTNLSDHTALSAMFGPYIPVFAYWVAPWVGRSTDFFNMHYPEGMLSALRGVLRKDVPYVTVSQSDAGLPGWGEFPYSDYPNLLVLSAGGYGHASLPLHLTDGGWDNSARTRSVQLLGHQCRRGPVRERRNFVNFVGRLRGHGPVRYPMVAALQDFVSAHGNNSDLVRFYRGSNWTDVMRDSRFSLVPRGAGRTAYHLVETIQLGLIPIYVYDDIPWVPFPEIFKKFGFQTDVKGLPLLLERLLEMPNETVEALEKQVAQFAHSHFTPAAEGRQILNFLTGSEASDITCMRLPNSSGVSLN